MADQEIKAPIMINEKVKEEEEKRIQHYSSFHQILLVGDGDFSFSLCLAVAFQSASNIVASSLPSYDEVIKMYKNGKSNIEKLKSLGGAVLHGVDATKIQHHPGLSNRQFDRIIFNFPHFGFFHLINEEDEGVIKMHKNLVSSFMGSAKRMLRVNGQIHINHKTTPPYDLWDLVGLGKHNSLKCIECTDFRKKDYPGYDNKKGSGTKCDEPFPLGECQTFMFKPDTSTNMPMAKQKKRKLHAPSQKFQKVPKLNFHASPQKFQKVPNSMIPPTYSFEQKLINQINSKSPPTYVNDMNHFPSNAGLPVARDSRRECSSIFKPYFSCIQEQFARREDIGVDVSLRQRALILLYGSETRRPPETYMKSCQELHIQRQPRFFR